MSCSGLDGKYCIKKTKGSVELWSIKYLNFEPKDWLIKMRKKLSKALTKVESNDDNILRAIYVSDRKPSRADPENILFYNIHYYCKDAFVNLCQRGLSFEFQPLKPLFEKRKEFEPYHYYQYNVLDMGEQAPEYWEEGLPLVEWDFSCRSIQEVSRPYEFWYALKSNTCEMKIHNYLDEPQCYGLRIELSVPESEFINLAVLVKPLFDGTISAFYKYLDSDNDVDKKADKIAKQLDVSSTIVKDYLFDRCGENTACLGESKFITSNMRWSPPDNLCVFGEVIRSVGPFRFSGSLFPVEGNC